MKQIHRTTVDIMGLKFDVEVLFKVTSYGSAGSYDEPPEGPEIELDRILSCDTGMDVTDIVTSYRLTDPKIWQSVEYDAGYQDPVRTALFGAVLPFWKDTIGPRKVTFFLSGVWLSELIEEEILSVPEYFEPDYSDYDGYGWEDP